MPERAECAVCYCLKRKVAMRKTSRIVGSVVWPFFAATRLDLLAVKPRFLALGASDGELSALLPLDGSPGPPSDRLIDLVPALVGRAKVARLPALAERRAPSHVHRWPGHHYRLLAALVEELRPRSVVEIGTFTGLSALAILPALPTDGQLVTIDVIPWYEISGTFLKNSDFVGGKLTQIVCDLREAQTCTMHSSLLREADLIFVDGPKDGVFERKLAQNFDLLGLKPGALVVFDDIRIWNMLRIWQEIAHPKLDLTGLGHWTGTGLVDWRAVSNLPR
jgi:predicted O-methyltransferase YrrM